MICPICGAEFELNDIFRKYCSKACARKADYRCKRTGIATKRQPFTFHCGHCGKPVITEPYKDHRVKYCSKRCHDRAKEQRKELRKKSRRGNGNGGLSGGMSLQSLIRRESRDLD